MSFTGDDWDGLADAQVHKLADRLLAEAELLLEKGWYAEPLSHDVEGLRALAADYPCFGDRLRRDVEFSERFELVVAAWKDLRPEESASVPNVPEPARQAHQMSLVPVPRDERDLPVGTELGNGSRVGHGRVLTGTLVQLSDAQRREADMAAAVLSQPDSVGLRVSSEADAAAGQIVGAESWTPCIFQVRLDDGRVVSRRASQLTLYRDREEAAMPAAAEKSRAKSKSTAAKKAAWKELPDDKLAAYLLEHPTLPDSSWSDRAGRSSRRKGESRSDFVRRVLLGAESAAS